MVVHIAQPCDFMLTCLHESYILVLPPPCVRVSHAIQGGDCIRIHSTKCTFSASLFAINISANKYRGRQCSADGLHIRTLLLTRQTGLLSVNA